MYDIIATIAVLVILAVVVLGLYYSNTHPGI